MSIDAGTATVVSKDRGLGPFVDAGRFGAPEAEGTTARATATEAVDNTVISRVRAVNRSRSPASPIAHRGYLRVGCAEFSSRHGNHRRWWRRRNT